MEFGRFGPLELDQDTFQEILRNIDCRTFGAMSKTNKEFLDFCMKSKFCTDRKLSCKFDKWCASKLFPVIKDMVHMVHRRPNSSDAEPITRKIAILKSGCVEEEKLTANKKHSTIPATLSRTEAINYPLAELDNTIILDFRDITPGSLPNSSPESLSELWKDALTQLREWNDATLYCALSEKSGRFRLEQDAENNAMWKISGARSLERP